jgi:hypothetical protein
MAYILWPPCRTARGFENLPFGIWAGRRKISRGPLTLYARIFNSDNKWYLSDGKSELQICESCVAIIPLRSSPMTVETLGSGFAITRSKNIRSFRQLRRRLFCKINSQELASERGRHLEWWYSLPIRCTTSTRRQPGVRNDMPSCTGRGSAPFWRRRRGSGLIWSLSTFHLLCPDPVFFENSLWENLINGKYVLLTKVDNDPLDWTVDSGVLIKSTITNGAFPLGISEFKNRARHL